MASATGIASGSGLISFSGETGEEWCFGEKKYH